MPKALVVTLSSGEAEEAESARSVLAQTEILVDHKTVKGLSERDAHNAMLEIFQGSVNDYDIFAKVDADTIVDYDNAFRIVYDTVEKTGAAAAQLGLFDYFSCTEILGLNFYHPQRNVFNTTSETLFCDRSIVHKAHHLYSVDFIGHNIIPVGRHCAYPHDRQSFHYGYHRGLKNRPVLETQVRNAAKKHHDRARILACMGFEAARQSRKSHDYNHSDFEEMFLKALQEFESYEHSI